MKRNNISENDFDDGIQRNGYKYARGILHALRESRLTRRERHQLARRILRTSAMPKSTERIHSFFALPLLGRQIMRRLRGN